MANDAELTKKFDPGNVAIMKKGFSPFVKKSERSGGRRKSELHHKQHISQEGGVYDIDSVSVVTPKRHIEIHRSIVDE